jgi:aldose 1-epimerase
MGGALVSLTTFDRNGNPIDVVLGHNRPEAYEGNGPFMGAQIGRYANRITGASFMLDGKRYELHQNEKARGNTLHGGLCFGQRHLWEATPVDAATLKLKLFSPNGEAGFPGNLTVTVTFHLTDDNELELTYDATTDAPTIICLTNHIYFNLNGCFSTDCKGHEVWARAYGHTEVDKNLSATGRTLPVVNTPYDLRMGRTFESIYDDKEQLPIAFDDNFVVANEAGNFQKGVFRVLSRKTGVQMELDTDQPGVQFYMGHWMGGMDGKYGVKYKQYGAFCLEPQLWPDSPNHPDFPNARLNPGEHYRHHSVYRFSVIQ